MKILIYGLNFSPELTGIGKYTGELADWLVRQGHEVHVVTAPPYYPAWQVAAGYPAGSYVTSPLGGGGSLTRCPLWVPARPRGLTRVLHLASFAAGSLPAVFYRALRHRPEVLVVVAPALLSAPSGWLAARLSGAACWLHVQDFEIDAAFGLGMLRGGVLKRFVRWAERWLMRRFDRVSTISGRMLERLADKGVDPDRRTLLPNWADPGLLIADRASVEAEAQAWRRQLGIADGTLVALYSGNLGHKQGIELLGEVAEMLRGDPSVCFVFGGQGAARADLEARCDGLPNVRWLELQPVERLPALLAMADVHLLPQRADAADLVMPSKLTGMLASGRPVIATAAPDTEVAQVVEGRGVVVAPGDAAAMAAAIRQLAADIGRRKALGEEAARYARQWLDREAILQRFEVELLRMARRG